MTMIQYKQYFPFCQAHGGCKLSLISCVISILCDEYDSISVLDISLRLRDPLLFTCGLVSELFAVRSILIAIKSISTCTF